MNWEEAREIIEEVKKRTGTYAYSLVIDPETKPDLSDSKFGGLPWWDMEKEYPTDSEGRKLMLLAQINLEQILRNPAGMRIIFYGETQGWPISLSTGKI